VHLGARSESGKVKLKSQRDVAVEIRDGLLARMQMVIDTALCKESMETAG